MKNIEELLSGLPEIDGRRLYIWGAGNTAMLFREGLARVPQLKIEAYVDNDPAKQNKTIGDAPIISADKMIKDENTLVLICTGQPAAFTAITKQLGDMGVDSANLEAVIFGLFREDVIKAYELLDDEESKRVYLTMLENRINCTFPEDDIIIPDQYYCLPKFRAAAAGETFIDCGAYVGDSVENYIWAHDGVFKKIIAFEPDKKNYTAMGFRMERLKKEWGISDDAVELYDYAVGDEDNTLYVESYDNNNGLGSKMSATKSSGSEECRTVTLADYITDKCFIKADIESYEYKMLKGAEAQIKEHKPIMSICIYHNSVDFFSIPLLVKSLVPEYKLSVRQHTYALSDTVLYCTL